MIKMMIMKDEGVINGNESRMRREEHESGRKDNRREEKNMQPERVHKKQH